VIYRKICLPDLTKNVKCTLVQALRLCTGRTTHRGSRGIALLFHDHGTRRGERSASRPGRSLPPGKNRYPLYRRLGGPQGRSRQVRKISPSPGFDPRTVQPVASRYTDYATGPTDLTKTCFKIFRLINCNAKKKIFNLKNFLQVTSKTFAGNFKNFLQVTSKLLAGNFKNFLQVTSKTSCR